MPTQQNGGAVAVEPMHLSLPVRAARLNSTVRPQEEHMERYYVRKIVSYAWTEIGIEDAECEELTRKETTRTCNPELHPHYASSENI
jgi:hypothetical protein